jgi:hypothetical protein
MKKLIVTSVVAALVAGALVTPAEAGKKKPKPRTIEGTYSNPAVGVPGVVGVPAAGGNAEFATLTSENYISVEVVDDSGGAPFITFSQDSNTANPGWEIFATACGKTDEPIQITPGLPIRVAVYAAPGREAPTCTGPATSGTIKATFTR